MLATLSQICFGLMHLPAGTAWLTQRERCVRIGESERIRDIRSFIKRFCDNTIVYRQHVRLLFEVNYPPYVSRVREKRVGSY